MSFRHVIMISLSLLVISAVNLDGLYAQSTAQDKGIYLIVRGDDIGSSHAADVACIQSYKEGIMTTVELMVPCPWFPEALKLLNENPGLDVGIHLVLTSEWENYKWRPLTWVPSLTDADGYFYPTIWQRKNMPPGTALRDAKWKIEEIEKEMRAQIELAKRKVPHVSHLTCHMGCSSWDPKVKKVYTQLAKEYNLDIAPSEYGVQRTAGFGDAKTKKERTKRFIEMLEGLKPGTHLFIDHPGLDTAEMRAIGHSGYYDVAKDRDAVTKVFISEQVKRAIKKLGIQLISYADLKKLRSGKDNLFTSPKQKVTCSDWHYFGTILKATSLPICRAWPPVVFSSGIVQVSLPLRHSAVCPLRYLPRQVLYKRTSYSPSGSPDIVNDSLATLTRGLTTQPKISLSAFIAQASQLGAAISAGSKSRFAKSISEANLEK